MSIYFIWFTVFQNQLKSSEYFGISDWGYISIWFGYLMIFHLCVNRIRFENYTSLHSEFFHFPFIFAYFFIQWGQHTVKLSSTEHCVRMKVKYCISTTWLRGGSLMSSCSVLKYVYLVTQLCPTVCGPMDCSPLGSSLSMGFSRQEYRSGFPFPTPGDLPDPGIKPLSLASPALAGSFFTTSATWEAFVFEIQKSKF